MDTIWRNAVKKVRAHEKQAASRTTTLSTPAVQNPPTTAPPPAFFDPKTGTLEELEQTSNRLQQDWPQEDGIPFPTEALETLSALRAAVIARDARKKPEAVQTLRQPASAELAEANAENVSKKSRKEATSPRETCPRQHHSLAYRYRNPTRCHHCCFKHADHHRSQLNPNRG
jgi:hypothetical protein